MDTHLPLTIENAKGRDLPRDWAERAGIGPDDVVRVSILPNQERRLAEIRALWNRIGANAAKLGLDETALLNDVPDFPLELLKE